MPSPLRCVFYDPDAVDAESHLSERAFEACARAGVDVFALAGDHDTVTYADEPQSIAWAMRALAYAPEECIGVGTALAGAPVSAVWVSHQDHEVRGPTVRDAQDGDELLYEAVVSELAQRR